MRSDNDILSLEIPHCCYHSKQKDKVIKRISIQRFNRETTVYVIEIRFKVRQGWHQEFSDGGMTLPTRG